MKKVFYALLILPTIIFSCKKEEKTEIKYTITFNTNGGSTIANVTINSGEKATKPINPTKTGYTFENWYSDEYLTKVFDFNTAISANLTLYAKWNVYIITGSAIINGKTYKTVTIGTQTWMAENLNDDGYTAGTSFYYYYIDCGTLNRFGRLYDRDAAMDIDNKIMGWHLPIDEEWRVLANALGGINIAGEKIKVGGGSGFEALLSGSQANDGNSYGMGTNAKFWVSSDRSGPEIYQFIAVNSASLHSYKYIDTNNRLSVRLIKD